MTKKFLPLLLCIGLLLATGCKKNVDTSSGSYGKPVTAEKSNINSSDADGFGDVSVNSTPDLTSSSESSGVESVPSESQSIKTQISSKSTSKTSSSAPKSCSHKNTTLKNRTSPSCTANGYTGDTYCADCGKLIKKGESIKASGHASTTIKNQKAPTETSEGYTGDTYCTTCNQKISSGKVIPKIKNGLVQYELFDGSIIEVPKGTDILEYTMKKAGKTASSEQPSLEKKLFDLINSERKKHGLYEYKNNTLAYYYAKKRADECEIIFDHVRPGSTANNPIPWYTVYTDQKIGWSESIGENLGFFKGEDTSDMAEQLIKEWLNSQNHKSNLLSDEYRSTAIAIHIVGDSYYIAQEFYG